ncbi:unnamed protein product [Orchesella dallaii]|uniref:Uncharacterized protein n=1 Tax=Orchesella dallaii TaxID=48710 RepID=A0ABP1QI41_9HEXA
MIKNVDVALTRGILPLSGLLSVLALTAIFGVSGIQERLINADVWDVAAAAFFFVCLFTFLCYLFVKMATFCAVYFAFFILLAVICPLNPNMHGRLLDKIFSEESSPNKKKLSFLFSTSDRLIHSFT